MIPRKIVPPPSITELITNRELWKNRILTFRGEKVVYDQDIRTGVCYFCKKAGRAQRSRTTCLHHVKYDNSDPLAWTIEVCSKCHYQIDSNNKKQVDRHYGRFKPKTYFQTLFF